MTRPVWSEDRQEVSFARAKRSHSGSRGKDLEPRQREPTQTKRDHGVLFCYGPIRNYWAVVGCPGSSWGSLNVSIGLSSRLSVGIECIYRLKSPKEALGICPEVDSIWVT